MKLKTYVSFFVFLLSIAFLTSISAEEDQSYNEIIARMELDECMPLKEHISKMRSLADKIIEIRQSLKKGDFREMAHAILVTPDYKKIEGKKLMDYFEGADEGKLKVIHIFLTNRLSKLGKLEVNKDCVAYIISEFRSIKRQQEKVLHNESFLSLFMLFHDEECPWSGY
jgi:hypothetical protein